MTNRTRKRTYKGAGRLRRLRDRGLTALKNLYRQTRRRRSRSRHSPHHNHNIQLPPITSQQDQDDFNRQIDQRLRALALNPSPVYSPHSPTIPPEFISRIRKNIDDPPGAQFRLKRATIERQLAQKIPADLAQLVSDHTAASTIKRYSRKRNIKREQLKRRFKEYNYYYGVNYDPMDPELAELMKVAAKLLTRNDYRNRFWRDILGNVYIGLHEKQRVGGPDAKFYNEVERNFGILLAKMMDYDIYAGDYLNDDNLYQTLVVPILGIND